MHRSESVSFRMVDAKGVQMTGNMQKAVMEKRLAREIGGITMALKSIETCLRELLGSEKATATEN